MKKDSAVGAYHEINNLLEDAINLTTEEYQTLSGMKAYFLNILEEESINMSEKKVCNYCFTLKDNFNEYPKMCDDCVEDTLDKEGI